MEYLTSDLEFPPIDPPVVVPPDIEMQALPPPANEEDHIPQFAKDYAGDTCVLPLIACYAHSFICSQRTPTMWLLLPSVKRSLQSPMC